MSLNGCRDDVSLSISSWGFSAAQLDKTFPIHQEIALPFTNIKPESDNAVVDTKATPASHIQIDPSDVTSVNLGFESDEEIKTTGSTSPPSTTHTSLPADGVQTTFPVYPSNKTRQSSMAIGEEWETFHKNRKSISCPPSLISGKREKQKGLFITKQPCSASEPGLDIDPDLHDNQTNEAKIMNPFPLQYFFSMPTSGIKDYHIYPNPYNTINHKFHSALQCPCFLYFFFICCLPGLHFMQRSDRKFKKGDRENARKLGRLSTFFYTVGSVVGVVFLSVCIFFAAQYVRQYVAN